jgi:hypothetical protein
LIFELFLRILIHKPGTFSSQPQNKSFSKSSYLAP